jgi:hypothetical protein
VELSTKTDADGTQIGRRVTCERDQVRRRGRWTCSDPYSRIEVDVRFDGESRRVGIQFGDSVATGTAREFALRAIAMFEDSQSMPHPCEISDATPTRPWAEVRTDYWQSTSHAPDTIRVERLHDAAGRLRVWLFSTLTLEFPDGCWTEWEEVEVD